MEFLEVGKYEDDGYVVKNIPIVSKQYMYLGVLVDGIDFMSSDHCVVYFRSTAYMADSTYGWSYNHERLKLPLIRKVYVEFEKECLALINEHLTKDNPSKKCNKHFNTQMYDIYQKFGVCDYYVSGFKEIGE